MQTESGQVLASATSLTVCLKCVLALGCHWRASSLAAAPPLPPFSILPGDSVSIHFSTAAPLYVCQIITILKKKHKTTNFPLPVLVPNHISVSLTDFLSHILLLLYLCRVRLFNPMIWMQGSVSHAASLRIRVRSLVLWLLFICRKDARTHSRSLALFLLCFCSRTPAFSFFSFLFICWHKLIPRKCSLDLLLPPDLLL